VNVIFICFRLLKTCEVRHIFEGLAANILNKQSQTADKGWSSSLEVGRGSKISSP